MPNSPLFSVYVLTYNSNPLKLQFTLDSIRAQDYPNIEVVIADDGSSIKSHFSLIEKFKNSSKNVNAILSPTNIGIVGNMKKALECCRGELVIGLSPGDGLYSKDTLSRTMEFYKSCNVPFFIGFFRAYRITKENRFEDVNFMAPNPENIRLLDNPSNTFKKLLMGNFISGAALVRSKRAIREESLKLPDSIRYLEDWTFFTLATYHNHKIPVYNGYIYWYEHGEGISTGKDSEWGDILRKDWLFFLKWLIQHKNDETKNRMIKKRVNQLDFFSKHKSKVLKGLYAIFFQQDLIFSRLFPKDELHSPEIAKFREELIKKQGNGFIEMLKSTLKNLAKEKRDDMEEG